MSGPGLGAAGAGGAADLGTATAAGATGSAWRSASSQGLERLEKEIYIHL